MVSVVVPTWNRMPFLREAVDSVLGQTYQHLELIVVDDGSTDGTAAYLDGVTDPRLRRVSLRHTGNPARARNAGAAVAEGRYLCFLDSDDLWLPNKLAHQVRETERAAACWSYTRYEHIDQGGERVPPRAGQWRPLSGRICEDLLTQRAAVGLVTVLLPRQVFEGLGGFDERPGIHEDFEFCVRLAATAEALAIPESLALVRIHPGRTTRTWSGEDPFLISAATYDVLLETLEDPDARRVARRQRGGYLAEAAAVQLSGGSVRAAAKTLFRAARAGAPLRRMASAIRRGIGLDRALLRRVLRLVLGRECRSWLLIRSPRLRYRCFGDPVDCVIHALLVSRRRVKFVQIGSNDGVTNDPLWTFRRWPRWTGLLVEPVPQVFDRLARNYRRWRRRFVLERAAVAGSSGIRPFHYLVASADRPTGYEQGGSLDRARAREHARAFGAADRIVSEPVPCYTFGELLDRHGLTAPDLVHVDAEGMDGEIVRQVAALPAPPAVLLYEHVHLCPSERDDLEVRLQRAGYESVRLGGDTLAVHRDAVGTLPALRSAWSVALRSPTPASPDTSS